MDASEARQHVEMIEKIIAVSSQRLEVGGELFLAWGAISGTIDVIWQVIVSGRLPAAALWGNLLLIVAGVLYTAARVRYYRRCGERMSLLQREFLNVLWLTLGMAFVVNVVAFRLFPDWAASAIWSVMAAVVLLYIGMHGNRRAILGAVVLVTSIAAANFVPQFVGYILAAGMYLGYAGFGLTEQLARE